MCYIYFYLFGDDVYLAVTVEDTHWFRIVNLTKFRCKCKMYVHCCNSRLSVM